MLGSLTDRLPRILPFSPARAARRSPNARPISVSREVLLFVAGCALAAALIGGASFWVVDRAATAEAINDAEVITQIDAQGIVSPLLSPALLAGNPSAIQALDAAVVARVLSSRVVRVKIWTAAGTVVYSDAHALIGQTFPLGSDEQEALADGETDSELSDLSRPENRYERSFGSLVEVYLPIRSANGTKLLFETYQRDSAIQADQERIWSGVFPALLAGITLLFIVQVPLGWRLARRLQRSSRDRAALLQRAIDSSETERWRIAGDLHDGPVQNLIAVAEEQGLTARLESGASGESQPHDDIGLVYRTAQESVRNVIKHAGATHLIIRVSRPRGVLTLEVIDDGCGFSTDDLRRRQQNGHVGLSLLQERVAEAGATMAIISAPGAGTTIRLQLAGS